MVLAWDIVLPGLLQPRHADPVDQVLRLGLLPAQQAGFVHVERHERAQCLQWPRGDNAAGQSPQVPHRQLWSRTSRCAQRLRVLPSHGHGTGPVGTCSQCTPVRVDEVLLRGISPSWRCVDWGQHGQVGSLGALCAHDRVPVSVRDLLLRCGRARLLLRSGARALQEVAPIGDLVPILQRARPLGDKAPGALDVGRRDHVHGEGTGDCAVSAPADVVHTLCRMGRLWFANSAASVVPQP
mmetsp:Transcript_144761/g.360963  ORF Transcript_144761/g.360963 Transcript_144761/m.360963 type:complete len:239 (+) Transcript_144761:1425-2141(+)